MIKKLIFFNIKLLWLSLLVSSTNGDLISTMEKNQLPAFISLDYNAELLGFAYGIDPTLPSLTSTGTITESGFNWTGGGIYLGDPVVWTSTGIYDPLINSLHWTGSGSYVGKPWTMSGDIKWLSDVDFLIAHQYWIGFPGENGVETVGWDSGTVESSKITFKIPSSKLRRSFLGIVRWERSNYTEIIVEDGNVIETISIKDKDGKVVLSVNGSGVIFKKNPSEYTFEKTTTVTPAPSALILGALGLAYTSWKLRRRKEL